MGTASSRLQLTRLLLHHYLPREPASTGTWWYRRRRVLLWGEGEYWREENSSARDIWRGVSGRWEVKMARSVATKEDGGNERKEA